MGTGRSSLFCSQWMPTSGTNGRGLALCPGASGPVLHPRASSGL